MAMADNQRRSLLSYVRQPAFWIAVVAYVALTVGEWAFLSSPLFRSFVEQNQTGFLSSFFSNTAGYDVVGAVVTEVRLRVFAILQGGAAVVAIVLLALHKYEAVALGILMVLLSYVAILVCAALLIFVSVRRGY